MRKSTNFNLNLVEGSDLVNPLVQDVPNYEKIDEQMYKNESNSIGVATELKSGTVHALTRQIPNATVFRFQATSNFAAGDTFTVDGIQVSALTPSGETLASGCYIIGSEVLCALRETLLTLYVSGGTVTTAQDSEKLGGQLPEYYGTAEDVSTALTTAQSANQLTLNLQKMVENMGSAKQNKLVLLWTNPNPTASFSAQTVNIDLSSYDGVVIDSARNDSGYFTRKVIQKGYNGYSFSGWIQPSGFGLNCRLCRVEESGIIFNDAYVYQYAGSGSGNVLNTMHIPLKIYGYVN